MQQHLCRQLNMYHVYFDIQRKFLNYINYILKCTYAYEPNHFWKPLQFKAWMEVDNK